MIKKHLRICALLLLTMLLLAALVSASAQNDPILRVYLRRLQLTDSARIDVSGTYTLELLIGVCALAFGVFSLINPTFLMDFLFTVLGLVVIVTSVSGIKRALNLRTFGYARWWLPMLLSCATLLVALSIVFMPQLYGNMLMMVIGAILIVESVGDLLSIHRLSSFARSITYTIDD